MDNEQIVGLLRDTVWTTLLLGAPILLTSLCSGLVVSIFQAATQINEQTLTFVPKIVLTLLVFALFFPHFATTLVEFTRNVVVLGTGATP